MSKNDTLAQNSLGSSQENIQKRFLEQNLDIILISSGDDKLFSQALEGIFASNSPIKNCDIVILDNSDCGKNFELVKEKYKSHKNIRYKKSSYSLSPELCAIKAVEYASKKYFWILTDEECDFCWDSFDKVYEALEQGSYDIVNVGRVSTMYEVLEPNDYEKLAITIKHLTYLSAGIYKTKMIDSDVMHNMYFLSSYLFPILAVVCASLNEGWKVFSLANHESLISYKNEFFVDKDFVIKNGDEAAPKILDKRQQIIFEVAFATCTDLLVDKNLKEYCVSMMSRNNELSFTGVVRKNIVKNLNLGLWDNLTTLYSHCSNDQKDRFYTLLSEYVEEFSGSVLVKTIRPKQEASAHIPFKPLVKNAIKRKLLSFLRIKY